MTSYHLSHSDVAIDDPARTSLVQTKIKVSKADPFQKGVTVYMGQTGNDLCLVAAITAYLQPMEQCLACSSIWRMEDLSLDLALSS